MIPRLASFTPVRFMLLCQLLLCLAVVVMTSSCQSQHAKDTAMTPMDKAEHDAHQPEKFNPAEKNVRVRIVANVNSLTLSSTGLLSIGTGGKDAVTLHPPVTLASAGGRVVVTAAGSRPLSLPNSGFWVIAQQGHTVVLGDKSYLGNLRVEYATGTYAKPDHMDVMVHLPMEQYLPGVLHAELYSSWPLETFKAQAIAARSYTYFEMGLNTGKTYDLEGSIASQAYAGAGAHDKAVAGVNKTRGVVLMWQGKVLPAFYSSACGGVNQYAGLVLPHGTQAAPINSPRAVCTWCQGSKYYRWGPITRDRLTLSRRIAAWGKASREDLAGLGTLVRVLVTGRTPAGRPTQFTLTDDSGKSFALGAESFRFACNFNASGLPAVSAEHNLRSSHCRVAILGNDIRFEHGRGFGHGVGLCQWGAQGLAQSGYNAQSILAFYYPGATLKKLY